MKKSIILAACAALFALAGFNGNADADEGMWLFNDLPVKHLQEKHGFTPTPEWSEHIMKSSVRFNVGGSASFISSNGLVLTNHHVGSDTLFKLSNDENDYYNDGFLAKSIDEELKAPDLELNQLINIVDVTAKVNAAVTDGLSAADAAKARRAAIADIEKVATDESKLRSNVITLYVAVAITFINTRSTPTCVWFGLRKPKLLSSVGTRTILNIRDSAWTHVFSEFTKTENQPRSSIS